MKMSLRNSIIWGACVALFIVSCRRADEVPVRILNRSCKVEIKNLLSLDNLGNDSMLIPVAKDFIPLLLPDIHADYQGLISYHGKKRVGKVKLYSFVLNQGENRTIRLVTVIGRKPVANIEVAANAQMESYSYKTIAVFENDSTIITKTLMCNLSDEQLENNECDSIFDTYRIRQTGLFVKISSDTIKAEPVVATPNDDEYTDEQFYYNGSSPCSWKSAGISNSRQFKDFFMEFRNMVKLNDKDQIANYIKYPIGKCNNETEFVAHYSEIFTNPVREAVLGQKIRQLFRDQRGVMIGDNVLWFKQINGKYKIVDIKK